MAGRRACGWRMAAAAALREKLGGSRRFRLEILAAEDDSNVPVRRGFHVPADRYRECWYPSVTRRRRMPSARQFSTPTRKLRRRLNSPSLAGRPPGAPPSLIALATELAWACQVSLDTTSHYAQANLETKRKALERLENPSGPSKPPSWKHDKNVLAWLDAL
jgi:hypothetical protein